MTFGVNVRWQGQEHKSRAANGVRLRVGPIAGPVTSVGNGSTATREGRELASMDVHLTEVLWSPTAVQQTTLKLRGLKKIISLLNCNFVGQALGCVSVEPFALQP